MGRGLDNAAIQLFLDKRCGKGESHDEFFRWCLNPTGTISNIICYELSGIDPNVKCFGTVNFLYNPSDSNSTEPNIPYAMNTSFICPNELQPEKSVKIPPATENITAEAFEMYQRSCDQELNGIPFSLQWWAILLIFLAVLMAVSIAAALFWKYFLRDRIYGKKGGAFGSSMDSQYTSAPISSYDRSKSGSKKGSSIAKATKNLSRQSKMPSRASNPTFSHTTRRSSLANSTH